MIFRRKFIIFGNLQIVCLALLFLSSGTSSKVCREKYVDENIANADIILSGTVRKVERNYSSDLYGALIEIHRIVKGREKVYDLFDLKIDDEDNHLRLKTKKNIKRVTVNGNTIFVLNFGSPNICESNVKPHDVRIFMLRIDSSKQLFLNSSIIQPISKELRNLNSLFENQFTDRCK